MTLAELNVAVQAAVNAGQANAEVVIVALNGTDDFVGVAFEAGMKPDGSPYFEVSACSADSADDAE